jgi:HlyD family secretion protein
LKGTIVTWCLAALGAIGCARAGADDQVSAPVVRGDLLIEVDVTGVLKAVRAAPLGPPASVDERSFKIARMASEGAQVKKGDKVLFLDTTDIERDLIERTAERDSAAKDVERKAHEIELTRRESELRVIEAEALARKARLKADLPVQYTAAVEVKLALIDLDSAEAELRMARQRLEHTTRLGQAELAFLRDRHARFAARTTRLEQAIEEMAVSAPIDGVVVYRANWRGEKKKLGDPCWVGESCLEVVDIREMEARGEVDEMESARVAEGQHVRLRLDALPETEWLGQVESLRQNVYRQSPRNPLKVIGINIRLEKTDPTRMRPGMQFRGRLETARLKNVVLAPVAAVFSRASGPVAFRKTATGWQKVLLELGRRSRRQVEVRRGLEAGDRVALQDLEEGAP